MGSILRYFNHAITHTKKLTITNGVYIMTTTNTLETMQVKAGETVNRITTVNVETQTVRMFNVSKNETTGQNYKVNWKFDFSNCTEQEILELAARSTVIAYRKNFRGVKEEEIESFADKTIDVKEAISTKRTTGKSPVAKVKDLMKGMSPEDIAQLLKDAGIETDTIETLNSDEFLGK